MNTLRINNHFLDNLRIITIFYFPRHNGSKLHINKGFYNNCNCIRDMKFQIFTLHKIIF